MWKPYAVYHWNVLTCIKRDTDTRPNLWCILSVMLSIYMAYWAHVFFFQASQAKANSHRRLCALFLKYNLDSPIKKKENPDCEMANPNVSPLTIYPHNLITQPGSSLNTGSMRIQINRLIRAAVEWWTKPISWVSTACPLRLKRDTEKVTSHKVTAPCRAAGRTHWGNLQHIWLIELDSGKHWSALSVLALMQKSYWFLIIFSSLLEQC